MLLTSRTPAREEALLERAAERGVRIYGMKEAALAPFETEHATVLLGYGGLDQERIKEGIRSWTRCFSAGRRSGDEDGNKNRYTCGRTEGIFAKGKTRDVNFRLAALRRLRDGIRRREKEIAAALHEDLHKSSFEAYMTEIGMALDEIGFLIKHTGEYAKPERVPAALSQFPAKCYIKKEPYGVTLIMSPWNYPFLLSIEPAAGAIAAGNCCIIKPSAYAPAVSRVIRELIKELFDPAFVAVVEGGERGKQPASGRKIRLYFLHRKRTGGKAGHEKGGGTSDAGHPGAWRKKPLHRGGGCGSESCGKADRIREAFKQRTDLCGARLLSGTGECHGTLSSLPCEVGAPFLGREPAGHIRTIPGW